VQKHFAAFAIILVTALPVIAQSPASTANFPSTTTQPPTAPAPRASSAAPSAKHTITVKFDYDFGRTPACSAKITKNCVQQFNVYDLSGGAANKFKLFSVPVPSGASGLLKGITGASPQLVFETGQHFIGVTAQSPSGNESSPVPCETSVQINP